MSSRSPAVTAIIPARAGSKGLPGKNLHRMDGRPLIDWTLEAASNCPELTDAWLSSEDDEILRRAELFGVNTIKRPPDLAEDESSTADVVFHALATIGSDPAVVVLLQPTSPLRTADDISAAIEVLIRSEAPAVVSVTPARTHPYLIRTIHQDGTLSPFTQTSESDSRRQSFPPVMELNGAVYAVRTEVFRQLRTFEPPGTMAYEMPEERSVDIDTLGDLKRAELLLRAQR
jgi:CMP-N,N'-diacetyllegionaminic acid synthase